MAALRDDGAEVTAVVADESALAAIEQGRVHVAPGAGVAARAQARVDALLTDLTAG